MSNATITPTPPKARTKRPPTSPPQRVDPPARAYDPDAIAREAAARDADLARREAELTAQLREISERRENARKARALLDASTTRERQAAAEQAALAERVAQREAYDAALAERTRLFREIQDLTGQLAAAIKEALAVDSRIYSAALVLGISQQRAGFAKRAVTDFVGRRLSNVGLTDMPRGRAMRPLVGDGGE